MTVRPLRVLGDPVLRTACDQVTRFDDALARLVADLLDTVHDQRSPCPAAPLLTAAFQRPAG